MKKVKKAAAIIVVIAVLAVTVQIVVAEALGIDILSMVQQKVNSLSNSSTTSVAGQLEQTKQETVNDTLNYIDTYMKDVKLNLDQYTIEQTEAAKQKIRSKNQEIKDALEAQKQGLIDSSKIKIKAQIDSDLNQQMSDLDSELTIKIKEKLK